MRKRLLLLFVATVLVATACAGDEPASNALPSEDDAAEVLAESISESPESLAVADVSPATSLSEEIDDEISTESIEEAPAEPEATAAAETCTAPALEAHFVDVALDDPDGGLNLRDGAGPNNAVLATIERGNELIPTGVCTFFGATPWWQVTNSDGSLIGHVSSRFLSDTAILNPGLGRVEIDDDNAGIFAETIEGLAAQLAIIYGFGEDVTITQVGDLVGNDASSGRATYDLTGLRDDSSNGYRVEILFFIERDASGEELFGFSATRIDRQSLCTRGVTDDGLCV